MNRAPAQGEVSLEDWTNLSRLGYDPLVTTVPRRKDAVQPGNAKRSDVRKILNAAAEYFEAIVVAWMEMHR